MRGIIIAGGTASETAVNKSARAGAVPSDVSSLCMHSETRRVLPANKKRFRHLCRACPVIAPASGKFSVRYVRQIDRRDPGSVFFCSFFRRKNTPQIEVTEESAIEEIA